MWQQQSRMRLVPAAAALPRVAQQGALGSRLNADRGHLNSQ